MRSLIAMKHQGKFPVIFPDGLFQTIQNGIAKRFTNHDSVRTERIARAADSLPLDVDIDAFPTLEPALTPVTELWLTILYVSLYGLLFFMVYFQLWMIWYYRHKRLSYQTVFLFLCLVWTGLRTTLFSFYFTDCILVNNLPLPFTWLLYCFPVCLQFTTLCLLVLFFAQVVFKAKAKYEPSQYKRPLRIGIALAILIFFITNMTAAIVVNYQSIQYHSVPISVIIVRVSINDSLFVMSATVLSVCIYKMSRMASAHVVLEAKGTTLCQAMTTSIVIILLFTSRAVYNIIALLPYTKEKMPSFGYNWVNVSDQADIIDLDGGYAYVSFGIVLFVWEFLPTLIIVVFFRVKKPPTDSALSDMAAQHQNSRSYFFDNPRRYDSDDDLTRSAHSRASNYDINYGHASINNTEGPKTTPRGTPRGTPWGTPRGNYGATNVGSFTGRVVGYGSPATGGNQGANQGVQNPGYQNPAE